MIALVLLPFYIAFFAYLYLLIVKWIFTISNKLRNKYFLIGFGILLAFFAFLPFSSVIFSKSSIYYFIKKTSNYFLGVLLFFSILLILSHLIYKIVKWVMRKNENFGWKKLHFSLGVSVLTLTVILTIFSSVHVTNVAQKKYEVEISKALDLNIVVISDLHLGINTTTRHIENIVKIINEQEADVVCIVGDIFDNSYDDIQNPAKISALLAQIESKYGTYAVFGNHDIDEDILLGFTFSKEHHYDDTRMREFLDSSKVTLLDDETVFINEEFYLIGRKDRSRSRKIGVERKEISDLVMGCDTNKPIIVLDHQPSEFESMVASKVDLLISGHTHNGQLFPGNILINFVWKNAYGLYQNGSFNSIVTSGVGTWGPNMRLFTNNEVVNIQLIGK